LSEEFGKLKYEVRKPKFETIPNDLNQMIQKINDLSGESIFFVFVIKTFDIRIYFVFRYSGLKF